MAKEGIKFTINPNDIKVRDLMIKKMITSTGGVVRVFDDRKREQKSDKARRKVKHKKKIEE